MLERFWKHFGALAFILLLCACARGVDEIEDGQLDARSGGDASGTDTRSSDTGPTCRPGETLCGTRCVNTQSDNANCGACGRACAPGEYCNAGTCSTMCSAPRTVCTAGGTMVCVDTQSDPMHCGMCGNACGEGRICMSGRCACPGGLTLCGDRCVDTRADSTNCGSCGNACAPGQYCNGGTCSTMCSAPRTVCTAGGTMVCVDTQSDSSHCGMCNNACAAGLICMSGRCACPGGLTPCGGGCVDTRNDPSNCGSCGNACAPGQTCSGGTCMCPSGLTLCGGRCVDTRTDSSNCGSCGNACAPGQTCSGGTCACSGGLTLCGGRCVDTRTDSSNCGSCGNACLAGQSCSGGSCTCSGGLTLCGGMCVNTGTDPSNCGSCGNRCNLPNATAGCSGGSCTVSSCNSGWGNCDGSATNGCETNLNTSNSHCGACGRACAPGQSCSGGSCISSGPPNDTRAGATVINMSVQQSLLSANTSTANNNTTGNCGCTSGRDVFFQFTIAAGQSEIVYADTVGATWDTSLFLQDSAGNNLTAANITNGLVCNDDGGLSGCSTGLQSQIMARLGPGTYYLVLSGCGSGAATIRFQHIPTGNGTLTLLNAGSNLTVSGTTSGTGRLSCGGGPENTYFWYSCPGYAGGSFSASTCSRASWDTKLEQVSPARGTSVCEDDSCGLQTTVTATIPSGPGIHALHIDGFCSTCAGSYSILYTRP